MPKDEEDSEEDPSEKASDDGECNKEKGAPTFGERNMAVGVKIIYQLLY